MKYFLIYTNIHKDKDLAVTDHIRTYLEEKDAQVSVLTGTDRLTEAMLQADCMIVLGGDGTMLQAAREITAYKIPLIGVNLGTLGYMTALELPDLEEALDRLLADDFQVESRMMLKGRITTGEYRGEEDCALNDIVITRRGALQIIRYHVYVNGQFLSSYNGDGLIVTTPTGSTGYNLSAGGPIVEPQARLIMLTPICVHTLNQRSIILSPEDVVEIEIAQGREGREQWAEVSFDGSNPIPLSEGDRIRITQAGRHTEFIQLNQVSFLDVLHRKMSEGK